MNHKYLTIICIPIFLITLSSFIFINRDDINYQKEKLYFLFDENGDDMITYYRGRNVITKEVLGELHYQYNFKKGHIIFEEKSKDSNYVVSKIYEKKLNIKNIDWLSQNSNNGLEYNAMKILQEKDIYIVTKDTINNKIETKIHPVNYIIMTP